MWMFPRAIRVSLALLCACVMAGCLSGRPAGVAREQGVLLRLHNQQLEDIRIYLVRGASPIPLGRVGGFETARIWIPEALLESAGTVALSAVSLASRRTIRSVPVPVRPGATVIWHVGSVPALSSIEVR